MQAEFIKKIQWQPTRLSVGSAAAETLKTDNNILFLGRGVHVNEDGKFAPLPSLEYHESEEIDQDFAQLSCEANC